MASKTYPQLQAATEIADTDLLAIYPISTGPLKKVPAGDVRSYVGGGAFGTWDAVEAAVVSAGSQSITVNAFSATTDKSPATFVRVTSEPTHPGKIRSLDRFLPDGSTSPANGGWWSISGEEINFYQLGAMGDDATDDTVAIQNTFLAALGIGATVGMPAGTFLSNNAAVTATGLPVRWFGRGGTIKGMAGGSPILITLTGGTTCEINGLSIDGNYLNTLPGNTSLNFGDAAIQIYDFTESVLSLNNSAVRTKYHAIKTLRCDNVTSRGDRVKDFYASLFTVYGGDNCVVEDWYAEGMLNTTYYGNHIINMACWPISATPTNTNKNAVIRNGQIYNCANTGAQFTGSENTTFTNVVADLLGWCTVKWDGATGVHTVDQVKSTRNGGRMFYWDGAAIGESTGSWVITNVQMSDFSVAYQFGRPLDSGAGNLVGFYNPPENSLFSSFDVTADEGTAMLFPGVRANISFTDGRFRDGDNYLVTATADLSNITFTNVTFENSAKSALTALGARYTGITLRGCHFTNVSHTPGGSSPDQAMVAVGDTNPLFVIEDNVFDMSSTGVTVYQSSVSTGGGIYANNRHVIGIVGEAVRVGANWHASTSYGRTTDRTRVEGNTYEGSFALNWGNVAGGGGTAFVDVTCPGINQYDKVTAVADSLPANVSITLAAYQAANTLRITVVNAGVPAVDVASTTRVRVFQQVASRGPHVKGGVVTLGSVGTGGATFSFPAMLASDRFRLNRDVAGGTRGYLQGTRVVGTGVNVLATDSAGVAVAETSTVWVEIV